MANMPEIASPTPLLKVDDPQQSTATPSATPTSGSESKMADSESKEADNGYDIKTHTAVIVPESDADRKKDIHPDDVMNVPKLSLLGIFAKFLHFGIRAFGGPMAQINMMRHELVEQEKWITPVRFNRVYAVYQILPGPEATELACYFGLIAGGRVGALLGGLGFITPGLLLMLLFSWLYSNYGIENHTFQAIFSAIQPAVCAMVFRAAHKIGDSGCRDPKTKQLDSRLLILAAMGAFESVLNVNFFITKAHLAFLYIAMKREKWMLAWFIGIAGLAVFIGVILGVGPMLDLVPQGLGVAKELGNTPAAQYVVGLLGGLVTFGGAFTAIPFIQFETVHDGKWISNQTFLDSLAIGQLLPAPLVMFVTLVGYAAGGIGAALLMTLGMFTPAFLMPVLFHDYFERIATNRGVIADILDSMTATVVGLVAIAGLQLMRSSILRPLDAVIFVASMQVLYNVPHKYTPVVLVAGAAMAGQVLFA